MKKQILVRATSVALAMLLALTLLLSFVLPSYGETYTLDPSFMQQFTEPLVSNRDQYFNSSVVQKLPSNVQDDDDISVILSLDKPALLDKYHSGDMSVSFTDYATSSEAEELKNSILSEKQEILYALDKKGISYETGADYSTVLSGFEIIIKAKDFNGVCSSVGKGVTPIVSEVYNVADTKLVENSVNVDANTGIFNSKDYPYDGKGMVVAVLDTGLDYTHSAFDPSRFHTDTAVLALTKDDIAKIIGSTEASKLFEGLTSDDVYINAKVPFSFDYADRDSDVYSLHNNHGTHVSGVIVGNDDTILGVAPNAQLVSMKIFSDVKDSAISSWILSALEDCVKLGVDVINMSLGTPCGFSRESDEEQISGVYEKIRQHGISLVVAASNSYSSAHGSEKNGNLGLTSNPDTSTVGSPSTYDGAMSIASINGTKTPYILHDGKIIYFTESSDASAEEKFFVDELLTEGQNEITIEFVVVPGIGRDSSYRNIDVKGKIALVMRGDTTFEEKAITAEKWGAAGIIVYNNTSGDIRMNVGTVSIPACSISQEDGEKLASTKGGVIKISREQTSGPFMSDFSSWGPAPDLSIKPELTAHGGNILSAVTGGGYDRLSGTSMACPNTAGVIILLRQYVKDNFPGIKDDDVKVTALVNCLLMSTADIIYNKNGLPYAVRKQGAGLASLVDASMTTAYIQTFDREDGSIMDKTKIELGDDKEKTGVYVLNFAVNNFGSTSVSYDLSTYVLTEGVSDVLTHKGETTITEEGYLLEGATVTIEIDNNGTKNGNSITVGAGKTAKVKVTITLSEQNKEYLDKSFENGMYVEGFVMLKATGETKQDLNVPFLAFYGDWTKAPVLDLEYFETNEDELDDSIATLDKNLPDAYATTPIGGLYSDYISYLGSYYFKQNPNDKIIAANKDFIALSNVKIPDSSPEDDQGIATIHSLRFIWTGMLRNAEKVVVTITDDATGEVIFETIDYDVRKSYSDGGAYIYPANVEIEFDTADYDLKNNATYTVKMVAHMDYEDGGLDSNLRNVFEFPLTIDFQAPALTDCTFRTEYDRSAKKTRLFATMAIYDNHYAMALQPGYVITNEEGSFELIPFESYMTPIYSTRNGTTYVEYELTDFLQTLKDAKMYSNAFVINCYDYALNRSAYVIGLPDQYVDFYFEHDAKKLNEAGELMISVNELYDLKPLVYPDTEWGELLTYTSSNQRAVKIVNNKLVGVGSGLSLIKATDENGKSVAFNVRCVASKNEVGKQGQDYGKYFKTYSKPVAETFEITGFDVLKVFNLMDGSDIDLGTKAGDYKIFSKGETLEIKMYPSESIKLKYALEAYFPNDCEVTFTSGNRDIVSVTRDGIVTAESEGISSISVKVLMDGKSTYYSKTITIEVKDPYIVSAPRLTSYRGKGGVVEIPDDLRITHIGAFAFSNFEYVLKTAEEYAEDDNSMTKQAPVGENTITEIIIPEGVKEIDAYAFAKLTALKRVVLPSTIEEIEYGAFEGCTSLEVVEGLENVMLLNNYAFKDCNLKGTIKLDSIRALGDYAFYNNRNLSKVVLPKELQSIGAYAFAYNLGLKDIVVNADKVKYGPYVFAGCTSLTEMSMNASVIPVGAFSDCRNLTSLEIGKDVSYIGEFAFANTKLSEFTINQANTAYKTSSDGRFLLSKDGTTIISALPTLIGNVSIDDQSITKIGNGAFANNRNIISISAPYITIVNPYAFSNCVFLKSVTFGSLTEIYEQAFYRSGITAFNLDGVKKIGYAAFAYTQIQSVVLGDDVVIDGLAFYECKSLKSVEIGDNAVIGDGAFGSYWDWYGFSNAEFLLKADAPITVYYAHFKSSLTSLKIGKNAKIDRSAFFGSNELLSIELGEGAEIGEMAFYNCDKLKTVTNLSKAKKIGKNAFSGDETYTFESNNGTGYMAVYDNQYIIHTYGADFEALDLSSVEEIDDGAFSFATKLEEVTLNPQMVKLGQRVFFNCKALERINLENVVEIGSEAFTYTALKEIDLSKAEKIGDNAFTYCYELKKVTLNENGCEIGKGAFNSASKLDTVVNMNKVRVIGADAFALTKITEVDLSGATHIGDLAFYKDTPTDFVILGLSNKLEYLGDNPFAMCNIAPFSTVQNVEFNGVKYPTTVYTFDISENVKVIGGSLYCKVPNGLELIVYAGNDDTFVEVAPDTVRITAYAFAEKGVVRVKLPYTLKSIGHKAFFGCDKLVSIIFTSHVAPVLEEQYDQSYLTDENIIGTKYQVPSADGSTIEYIYGLGLVPFEMVAPISVTTDGSVATTYSVYYGASFKSYIGKLNNKLIMIRPSNGTEYDSFVFAQYFDTVIDGSVAAEKQTLIAIEAINNLPSKVMLSHEALVVLARNEYNKIATKDQQALVSNYATLLTAEQRILAFKESNTPKPDVKPDAPITPDVEDEREGTPLTAFVIIEAVVIVAALALAVIVLVDKKKALAGLSAESTAEAQPVEEKPSEEKPSEDATTDEAPSSEKENTETQE